MTKRAVFIEVREGSVAGTVTPQNPPAPALPPQGVAVLNLLTGQPIPATNGSVAGESAAGRSPNG